MDLLRDLLDALRWRIWPRRLLVSGLLAAAAVAALLPRRAPAPPTVVTVTAVVAARPMPAGHVLRPADLRTVRRPPATLPAEAVGRLRDLSGTRLAGPVTAGEVLTPLRVVGPGLAAGLPGGAVAVPLSIDAASAGFVRRGDHVDLYRTAVPSSDVSGAPIPGARAVRVASGVLVLAVLPVPSDPVTTTDQAASGELVVAAGGELVATLVTERANPLYAVVTPDP